MLMRGGDSGSDKISEMAEWIKELLPHTYVWRASKAFVNPEFQHSVGLIIQPGMQKTLSGFVQLLSNPVQVANAWGHTAVFVRQKRQIVQTIGFDPDRLRMAYDVSHGTAVGAGKTSTPGVYYDEDQMFNSPDALVVEFEVDADTAAKIAGAFPKPGFAQKGSKSELSLYLTHHGKKLITKGTQHPEFNEETMGNCIDFVQRLLQQHNFGIKRSFINDCDSSQGQLTKRILKRNMDQFQKLGEMQMRVRTMPKALRVSRWTGGVLRTISVTRCSFEVVRNVLSLVGVTGLGKDNPYLWEILFTVSLIVDFLETALPHGSWTKLPLPLIETIVANSATIAFLLSLYNGLDGGWMAAVMSITMLFNLTFRD